MSTVTADGFRLCSSPPPAGRGTRAGVVRREQADRHSVHFYSNFLAACALRAAGASKEFIMDMLRWLSEDALKLYARLSSTLNEYAT
eukprot:2101442-Pleurochrysis_carterae.AAC.1